MNKLLIILLLSAIHVTLSQAQVMNKAASFKGIENSKASFNKVSELKNSADYTFEAWIYIDQWNENSYIFRQDNGKNPVSMQLASKANKNITFQIGDSGKIAQASGIAITVGTWHHVAMAYNGSKIKKEFNFYIDGKLHPINYIKSNTELRQNSSTNFELAANKFKGKIDEVRVWNKALTAAELDYKNTINERHPLIKNLAAYWKMDDSNLTILDNKQKNNGQLKDSDLVSVTDNKNFAYRIVSSYIRSNFYESNQISEESILNNNDIVYMAANVSANGDLFHEFPINNGKLSNAKYLSSFDGRSGVIQFNGKGALMNAGKGLLTRADEATHTFSFSTWIYIDKWVENSYIFKKYKDDLNKVGIQLGSSKNQLLKIHVANGADADVEVNSGLTHGAWHHLAVVYNGTLANQGKLKIYVDGKIKPWNNAAVDLPKSAPFFNGDFELGVNLKGKLDETSVNQSALTQQEILTNSKGPLVINSWSSSKTTAYWKFDNQENPGQDSRTWVGVLNGLKQTLKSKTGAKLRLGIIQGEWKKMSASPEAMANFVTKVKQLVVDYKFDGVDLDFEWCYTPQEWTNYSKTIIVLRAELPKGSIFSVTLHPLFYQITPEAIAAIDFVSIQSYGPRPARFPYPEFVDNVHAMIKYGYPKNKLVMGLPFYAVASDDSKVTTSYKTIVNQYPNLSPNVDEENVLIGSKMLKMTFNGQETITKKAEFVRDLDLLGVMYWDIATDVDLNHNLSLLKSLNSILNANVVDQTNIESQKSN